MVTTTFIVLASSAAVLAVALAIFISIRLLRRSRALIAPLKSSLLVYDKRTNRTYYSENLHPVLINNVEKLMSANVLKCKERELQTLFDPVLRQIQTPVNKTKNSKVYKNSKLLYTKNGTSLDIDFTVRNISDAFGNSGVAGIKLLEYRYK